MKRFFSVLLILAMLCVPAFAEEEEDIPEDEGEEITAEELSGFVRIGDMHEVDELYCMADTEEDAMVVAECYNITLTRFDSGIAFFKNTSGIPTGELIATGMENGWVPVALNRTITLWDETPGHTVPKDPSAPENNSIPGLPEIPEFP